MSKHLAEIIFWAEKKAVEIDAQLTKQEAAVMKSELFKAVTLYNRINSIFDDVPNFEVKLDEAITGKVDYDKILTNPGYRNESSIKHVSDSLDNALENRDDVAVHSGTPGSGKNGISNIRRAYAKKIMIDASANLQAALYKIITNNDYTLSSKNVNGIGTTIDVSITYAGTLIKNSQWGGIYSGFGLIKSLVQARQKINKTITREEKSDLRRNAMKSVAITGAGLGATAITAAGFIGVGIAAGAGLAMYSVSEAGISLLKGLRDRRNAQADLLAAIIEWNQFAIYIISSTDDGRDWDSSSFGAMRDIENKKTMYIA